MYLKIMGADGKSFRIIANITRAAFARSASDQAEVRVEFVDSDDGETFLAEGACYLLNDDGKTLAYFSVMPPREAVPPWFGPAC